MIRDPMQALERDLQAERASALARITDLFEKALEAWEALEAGELPPLSSREAELARRTELRELTAERLWMLLVQRETVGLRDHREMLQRVPQEIRLRSARGGPLPPDRVKESNASKMFPKRGRGESNRTVAPGVLARCPSKSENVPPGALGKPFRCRWNCSGYGVCETESDASAGPCEHPPARPSEECFASGGSRNRGARAWPLTVRAPSARP